MNAWKNEAAKLAVARADSLEDSGDIRGAIDVLSAELIRQPKNAPLLARRGRLQYLLKQWSTALSDFSGALAEKADAETTLYYRGMTHAQLNNIDAAIHDLTRVTKLNSKAGDAWSELGFLFRFKGNATESRRAFEKALACDAETYDWVRTYIDTTTLD
ncbi:MAG: tetratricopeptide repeat protein [Myxococcota bacterium]